MLGKIILNEDEKYVDVTDHSSDILYYVTIEDRQVRMEWTKNALLSIFNAICNGYKENKDSKMTEFKEYLDWYYEDPTRIPGEQFNILDPTERVYISTKHDMLNMPNPLLEADPIHIKLQMNYLHNWKDYETKKIIPNFQKALSRLSKEIQIIEDHSLIKM